MNLNSKKVIFVGWGCENPQDTHMYQIYYLILKKIFPKLKTFDTKKYYFQYGKDFVNHSLLETLDKNFDLIILAMENDEISPETLEKIKKDYPNMKLILLICDDDSRFDSWSRYYALFFDGIIQSPDMSLEYKKEKIKNAFFHFDYNTYKLGPMNIEKKYDVTFIGRPKADRHEIIKYLLDNGIKIKLFGWDWYRYPEFKKIYGGPLSQEDYATVINQTKINLILTKAGYSEESKSEKGHYNMKGRFFETALCKGFQIIEDYSGIERFFKDKKETVLFKTKKELLDKIKYYLNHEKERKRIAENSYKKVLRKFNRKKHLEGIFIKILQSNKSNKLPNNSKKKVIILTKKDLFLNIEELKQKLKGVDYISFSYGKCKNSKYKLPFQVYSLEKTNKPISCCDYYVSSFGLRDYMQFLSKFAFKRIGKEANKFININQLMVKREFFMENISIFKELFDGKNVNLINEENTTFISIPLLTIRKIEKTKYEDMKKAFEMKFPNELFSLIYQKKIITSSYPYMLLLKSLFGNLFILRYSIELLKSGSTKDKLFVNKIYIQNSLLEKYAKQYTNL